MTSASDRVATGQAAPDSVATGQAGPDRPSGPISGPISSIERRHLRGRVRLFLRYATRGGTVKRALKVACVITPILIVLNHWAEIVELRLGLAFWLQVALTFCVPYCVSTYSSAMAAIAEHHRMGTDPTAP